MNRRLSFLMAAAALSITARLVAEPVLGATQATVYEISAPITPRVVGGTVNLYSFEGANYPATIAEAQTVASGVAHTFDQLLTDCAALTNPATSAPYDIDVSDAEPSEARLIANYNAVASCAYNEFGGKPYWIPRLVHEVDICADKLGPDWHLPTEAEIGTLTAEEVDAVVDVLASSASSFGSFYFSWSFYVRAADGLKRATLTPGQSPSISDEIDETQTTHLESGVVLRCARGTL